MTKFQHRADSDMTVTALEDAPNGTALVEIKLDDSDTEPDHEELEKDKQNQTFCATFSKVSSFMSAYNICR